MTDQDRRRDKGSRSGVGRERREHGRKGHEHERKVKEVS